MATWYAAANGDADAISWTENADGSGESRDWSSTEGEDMEANNRTVSLPSGLTGFSRASLKTLNGGGFTVNTSAGNLAFTANIVAGMTDCIVASGSGYTLTVTGNVTGGSSANADGIQCNTAATVTVTGNVTGGSANPSNGINNNSTGTVTVNGTCTGGSSTNAEGLYNSSGVANISNAGNNACVGGSVANARGLWNISIGTATITGNVLASDYTGSFGANNGSTGTISVTGNVTGGNVASGASPYGIRNHVAGTVNITGTLRGGVVAGVDFAGYAVYNRQNTGTVNILAGSKLLFEAGRCPPVGGYVPLFDPAGTDYIQWAKTSEASQNFPLQLTAENVKDGVAHGTITGTYEGEGGGGGGPLIGASALISG